MANKTNEQVFKAALKTLTPFEVAIMRERLQVVCEQTLSAEGRKAIMEQKQSFIIPELFIASVENIKKAIDFEG